MTSSSYTRVLVHLRRATQGLYTCAQFDECLLDSLGLAGEGLVECSLQDNKLLLQCPAENVSTSACNARPPLYKIMASHIIRIVSCSIVHKPSKLLHLLPLYFVLSSDFATVLKK